VVQNRKQEQKPSSRQINKLRENTQEIVRREPPEDFAKIADAIAKQATDNASQSRWYWRIAHGTAASRCSTLGKLRAKNAAM
jgi:hypothetical protein